MDYHPDFGIHKLSEKAISLITQIDVSCNNVQDDTNSLLSVLINDAMANYKSFTSCQDLNIENANFKYDEFNGCIENLNPSAKFRVVDDKKRKDANKDSCLYEDNITVDNVELDKNQDVDKYYEIATAWKKQCSVAEQQKFITDMLANPTSISVLWTKILYPMILSEETFLEAVEILRDIIKYLPQEILDNMFLSLFKEKGSEINKGSYLIGLLSFLTNVQKNKLMNSFLNEFNSNIRDHHLNFLYMLSEASVLTNESIEKLLEQLLANVESINSERSFGNILILIAERLSSDTPQSIINLMMSLYNQFKGVMRIRIKNTLKTITEKKQPKQWN